MVRPGHDPRWPDKVIAAAMLTIAAGALGLLLPLIEFFGGTVGGEAAFLLAGVPRWAILALNLLAVVFGAIGMRHQAARWVVLAAVCGIVGLGFLGLSSLVALTALPFLVKGWMEGEEMRDDGVTMKAHEWPDKALMSSMFLLVVALACILQAALWSMEKAEAPWGQWTQVVFLACAAVCLLASAQMHQLRRPAFGFLGGAVGVASLALYVVGPLFGLLAIGMTFFGSREGEFLEHEHVVDDHEAHEQGSA